MTYSSVLAPAEENAEALAAEEPFEGVSIMKLRDGLITEYHEVANAAVGLAGLNFAPERIAKILAREARELRDRPEMARHVDP